MSTYDLACVGGMSHLAKHVIIPACNLKIDIVTATFEMILAHSTMPIFAIFNTAFSRLFSMPFRVYF